MSKKVTVKEFVGLCHKAEKKRTIDSVYKNKKLYSLFTEGPDGIKRAFLSDLEELL